MKFFKKQFKPDKSDTKWSEIPLENQKKNVKITTESFWFLGMEYSLSVLKSATLVKVYHEMRYETVSLYLDCFGRLFIKTYRKLIDLQGGIDNISTTFNFVKTEKEADALYLDGKYLWGIEPNIYESSEGVLSVYE